MTNTNATIKTIVENIKELKIRADKNQASLRVMKENNFKKSMIHSTECELARIAGMIDTYTSCYQMLTES